MSVEVEITVDGAGWRERRAIEPLVATAIRATIAASGAAVPAMAEVSVLLCDDAVIADLNGRWRGKPQPTNVLSFPSGTPGAILGDIAIACETTAREAAAEGKTFDAHLTHLAVHGTLHLLGFDHETASEADAMETMERRILATLGVADPYADGVTEHAGA